MDNLTFNLHLIFYPASQEAVKAFSTQMRIGFAKLLSFHWNLNVSDFESFEHPLITKLLNKHILSAQFWATF